MFWNPENFALLNGNHLQSMSTDTDRQWRQYLTETYLRDIWHCQTNSVEKLFVRNCWFWEDKDIARVLVKASFWIWEIGIYLYRIGNDASASWDLTETNLIRQSLISDAWFCCLVDESSGWKTPKKEKNFSFRRNWCKGKSRLSPFTESSLPSCPGIDIIGALLKHK